MYKEHSDSVAGTIFYYSPYCGIYPLYKIIMKSASENPEVIDRYNNIIITKEVEAIRAGETSFRG